MSTANPEVYGAPDDYILAVRMLHRDVASVNTLTGAFEFPKSPNFGGAEGDGVGELRRAISQNKIPLNTPIDLSVCEVGQDNKVSAFGSFAVWRVDHDGTNPKPTLDKRITINNNINTYFYTAWYGDSTLSNLHILSARTNFDIGRYQRWSPEAAYIVGTSGLYNPNMLIYPIVAKGAKSIIGCVWVGLYDSAAHGSGVTWVRLEEWKTTYNTRKIAAIGMSLHTPYNTAGSGASQTITYSDITDNNTYGTYQRISAGILNEIDGRYDYSFNIAHGTEAFGQSFIYFLDRYNFDNSSQLCPEDMRIYLPCEGLFDNNNVSWAWEKRVSGGDRVYIYRYISYNEANYEAIMKMAACFGIPFITKNISLRINMATGWNNNDIYFPVIDENGICHGEYTHGADNLTNPFNDLDNVREKNYDPTKDVDPNTYSNTTGFNSLSGGASATQRYVLDDSNVRQLLSDLWTITHNIAGVDYDKFDYKILDSFLVTDPINSIVSLKRFPFDIPHTFSPSKTPVCLGKNQGIAQGYLTYNVFNSIQFSGIDIYPKFGRSFLDFAPYTEYELYIPFCGTVKLNAGEILDHTLSVRMTIDLITGVCVAYILADSLCIETLTGSVSSDMQISGIDAATADGAVQNAVINHISARTNKEVADLSPLSPSGLMSAVTNPFKVSGSITEANTALTKADYDITHINTPIHSMGSAGGLSSWIQEFNCRLMIYYPEGEAIDSSGGVSSTSPKLADLTNYAHTTGFSCVMNGQVSDYHGLTVGNIDTSSIVGASEEERNMIKTLFSQGVWLP